jgi:hypothetical protein
MKKSQEYLTKIDYTAMLRRIGLSTKPLSSYQIKKEMEKYGSPESQTPYAYEMIKNLCPRRKNQLLPLSKLNRIPGNVEDESKLVSLINRYFQLNQSLLGAIPESVDKHRVSLISLRFLVLLRSLLMIQ